MAVSRQWPTYDAGTAVKQMQKIKLDRHPVSICNRQKKQRGKQASIAEDRIDFKTLAWPRLK